MSQGTDKDLENDKDDWDGNNPLIIFDNELSTTVTSNMIIEFSSSDRSNSKPCRSNYSKCSNHVENVEMHYYDECGTLSDTRKIDIRHRNLYNLDWSVIEYVFVLLCVIDCFKDVDTKISYSIVLNWYIDILRNETKRMLLYVTVSRVRVVSCFVKNTSLIYSIIESRKRNGLRFVKYCGCLMGINIL